AGHGRARPRLPAPAPAARRRRAGRPDHPCQPRPIPRHEGRTLMPAFSLAAALRPVLDDVPALPTVDVLVAGGGSARPVAPAAAARTGARVLLVERHGTLGGIGTAVLDTFYGFYTPGPNLHVVGGIAQEVVDHLTARDAAFIRPNTYGAGGGVTYS